MIKNFKRKGLKRLFEDGDKRGVPAQHADKIQRRLDAIDATPDVTDEERKHS